MMTSTFVSTVFIQPRAKRLLSLPGSILLRTWVSALLLFLSAFSVAAQCELTLTPTNLRFPTCGGNDGSFNVQVSGIVAPYQYTLSKEVNGSFVTQESGTLIAGTPTFVFLTGGTYKVAVSKGGTCSGEVTVELPQQQLTMGLGSITYPSCTENNGGFTIDVGGMTTPYQYTLSRVVNGSLTPVASGTWSSGPLMFSGLGGGVYEVAVTKGACSGSFRVYLNCETLGNEGCSPGYWKNQKASWITTNFSPMQTLESVFDVPNNYGLDNTTLIQILQSKGGPDLAGAAQTLLRAATAAVLNAAQQDVDYPITIQKIITDVNAALSSGNRETMLKLAATLDQYNNKYCPLEASKKKSVAAMNANADQQLMEMDLRLTALPNPSAHSFTVQIESSSKDKVTMRVVDMQGRLIEQRANVQPNQVIRLGERYTPGVYLLEVQQGTSRKQLKLLKIRN